MPKTLSQELRQLAVALRQDRILDCEVVMVERAAQLLEAAPSGATAGREPNVCKCGHAKIAHGIDGVESLACASVDDALEPCSCAEFVAAVPRAEIAATKQEALDDSVTRWAVYCDDLKELVGIGHHTPMQAEAFRQNCEEEEPNLGPYRVVALRQPADVQPMAWAMEIDGTICKAPLYLDHEEALRVLVTNNAWNDAHRITSRYSVVPLYTTPPSAPAGAAARTLAARVEQMLMGEDAGDLLCNTAGDAHRSLVGSDWLYLTVGDVLELCALATPPDAQEGR